MPGVTVACVLAAFAVTLIATPICRHLLVYHAVLDHPNDRSSHSQAVPRGGGLAILAAFGVAVAIAALQGEHLPWTIVGTTALMALVGFADDKFGLPAMPRLVFQVALGFTIGWLAGNIWLAILGATVVPACVNVVNFMDGINGITCATMTIWGISVCAEGLISSVDEIVTIGGVVAATASAFAVYNLRGMIFLGDVGSYLYGGAVGSTMILAVSTPAEMRILLAPLVLYFTDTGIAIARRALHGEPLLRAHRQHVYQQLVDAGLSHLTVTALVATASSAITVFNFLLAPAPAIALSTGVLALYFLAPSVATKS